jgi:MFS family permease
MAYFMVVLFLRLYVEKGLHYAELNPGRTVDQAVTILQSTLLLPLIISSVVAGIISDRLQKQKIVVLIAGLLSAFAFLLPALLGSWVMTLAWAVLFGIGYGAFFAVDTALAVQVLPNAADRGKDLGIIALAMAIPQIIAPLTSSAILSATGNNFSLLFFCACACAALAGLLVLRIKNAR